MLLKLFFEFFKIGLFSVGGGMATLPFIYDLGEKTSWFTASEVTDMIAVSESTPGPIGVNMATYTGFRVGGIPGACLATLGLILPGIIIVSLISLALGKFKGNAKVEAAFYGLRPCSAGLIAAAGLMIVSVSLLNTEAFNASGKLTDLFSWKGIILAVIIWLLTNKVQKTKKWHPAVFIAFSAIAGIVFGFAGV